jgi:hypothetical protein
MRPPSQPIAECSSISLLSQALKRLRWGRLLFQGSLAKNFMKPHLNRKNLGVVLQACPPSNGRKLKIGLQSRSAWVRSETLFPKSPNSRVAQAVECLPSKCEVQFKPQYLPPKKNNCGASHSDYSDWIMLI